MASKPGYAGSPRQQFCELGSAHITGHEQQRHEAVGILLGSVIPYRIGDDRVLQTRVGSRHAPAGGNNQSTGLASTDVADAPGRLEDVGAALS